MGDSPRPDYSSNRIAHVAERLHAARARVSQAQEVLTVAKDRLAQARLPLAEQMAPEPSNALLNDDPPQAENTPS